MAIYYAGIGSRETPSDVLSAMERIGARLAKQGAILRSGGALGADTAFETGCNRIDWSLKEIYLPWRNFNGLAGIEYIEADVSENSKAYRIARNAHPNWSGLSEGAKKLHTRNVYQILGKDTETKSSFVLCWTVNGQGAGGTGQAIRIAKDNKIPVFDFGKYKDIDIAEKHCEIFANIIILVEKGLKTQPENLTEIQKGDIYINSFNNQFNLIKSIPWADKNGNRMIYFESGNISKPDTWSYSVNFMKLKMFNDYVKDGSLSKCESTLKELGLYVIRNAAKEKEDQIILKSLETENLDEQEQNFETEAAKSKFNLVVAANASFKDFGDLYSGVRRYADINGLDEKDIVLIVPEGYRVEKLCHELAGQIGAKCISVPVLWDKFKEPSHALTDRCDRLAKMGDGLLSFNNGYGDKYLDMLERKMATAVRGGEFEEKKYSNETDYLYEHQQHPISGNKLIKDIPYEDEAGVVDLNGKIYYGRTYKSINIDEDGNKSEKRLFLVDTEEEKLSAEMRKAYHTVSNSYVFVSNDKHFIEIYDDDTNKVSKRELTDNELAAYKSMQDGIILPDTERKPTITEQKEVLAYNEINKNMVTSSLVMTLQFEQYLEPGMIDIFKTGADALINPVNCMGVSGRGLALEFKERYFDNYTAYRDQCKGNMLKPGDVYIHKCGSEWNNQVIINLPTKNDWRHPANIEDIKDGLSAMTEKLCTDERYKDIKSIAIPMLGCGEGGLAWEDVKPHIDEAKKILEESGKFKVIVCNEDYAGGLYEELDDIKAGMNELPEKDNNIKTATLNR